LDNEIRETLERTLVNAKRQSLRQAPEIEAHVPHDHAFTASQVGNGNIGIAATTERIGRTL
jgi:hypothetical protein